MATACHLLDNGITVTLIEKRPFLGGRAFSFTDPETGQETDNGQHVFLGCCEYYIDFLKKLGTFDKTYLQPKLWIKVLNPDQRAGYLSSSPLPAPFHLLPSFLLYRHLGFKDKLLALYAFTRITLTNRHNPSFSHQTFYGWLRSHRQTQRAIDNFWNPIVKPSLNDDVKDVSAASALMVFQEGLMKSRRSGCIGYSRVGLSALMGEAAKDYILRKGGHLVLGKSVAAIRLEGRRISGVEVAGSGPIRGEVYINALPFDVLAALLPDNVRHESFFAGLQKLSTSPIIDIHLWYDRPVMVDDFVTFINSPLQWVFNKSSIQGSNGATGQYLCISLSGAWEYIHQTKEELQRTFLEAMAQAFPKAREARVERVLVVKQDKATFRCLPETEGLRPKTETPIENFLLAGEWTDTGWPSTMEGAVKSGVTAAQAVVARSTS